MRARLRTAVSTILSLMFGAAMFAGCDRPSPRAAGIPGTATAGGAATDRAAPAEKSLEAPAAPVPSPEAGQQGLAQSQSAGNPSASSPSADAAAPPMVIRTGSAGIEVDSLEPGIRGLHDLAARLGGYVANISIQGGREQLRQATLELKVPADRFDALTSGLQPLGKLEYINVSAEDVGEEYTDISARVANARRLEARLIDLLATRTGKLQDVLAVERELARVREEIERYEGRLRYLKTRVALSTLAVTVHEPRPIIADHPGHSVIGDAFRHAWRNFVSVVAAIISATGALVPLAAVVAVAVFLWRRYRKP